jgi:hypothetical protein
LLFKSFRLMLFLMPLNRGKPLPKITGWTRS